eukprot:NODE_48_length_31852_cov_1.054168.p11 type:complete len:397 gc:universal NODE_48_length_31852_cov_1.054168:29468-30658(+)
MNSSIAVDLKLSCQGLKNKDTFSKSDPYIVVFEDSRILGKTEIIKDNLSPAFTKSIQLDYYFEKVQKLHFEIRDDDGNEKYDHLGEAKVVLCDIVTAGPDGFEVPILINGKSHGKLKIKAREIKKEMLNAYVKFSLSCTKLDKKDLFGKSDPYLLLFKIDKDGSLNKVHKTEIIKNTYDPNFQSFKLPLSDVGEEKVRLECWDWDRSSKDDIIGACEFNMQDFKSKDEYSEIELFNPTKKSGKRAGILIIKKIYIHKNWSFIDFIQSGTQLCFSVAIDYTASNGEMDKPGSLHYVGSQNQPSQVPTLYEQAIQSIGGILEYYDNDKQFPCYGFGAKFPNGKVSHDFHLNFNDNDPNVLGVPGILTAYRNCLMNVRLFGPTVIYINIELRTYYSQDD